MKFPGTKKEFDAWWVGKKDTYIRYRNESCPIARFLKHKGIEYPKVAFVTWYPSAYDGIRFPLPKWVARYVTKFDKALP